MLFFVVHRLGGSRKSAREVAASRLFCTTAGFSGSPNGERIGMMISGNLGMTPVLEHPPKLQLPWAKPDWFGTLLIACYALILKALIAGFIVWQQREELAAVKPNPNWRA
jgi:hypothetical protein